MGEFYFCVALFMNKDEKSDIFNLFLVYLIIVLLVPIMMAIDYLLLIDLKHFTLL